ncbi:HypC/HybG/HupF family hydrogenase formation chaperone [Candidatus Woesearchaeota archaeon]|nr:HypC/HybG/HupF family hydrogenase formation chaperone [Candidatus Woesearchaeota archaeon]MBW3005774.1 HypC/HybG/HupF family hydrogenase formation chaperone [Candidatus Woesearchaeota archaeon]
MCLAIPGKIIEIKGSTAVIDYGFEKREANASLIDDLKVGDFVIVNAGFVMDKVPEEQALKSLEAWKNAGKNG